jgi:fucose permease
MGVDVSTAVASFTFMSISIAVMVFATTGVLLNYMSLKKISLLTCILLFLSIGILLVVESIQMFNVALFVYGIGYGMAFSLSYYYIIIITDNKSRASKLAIVSICYSVGGMLSPKICHFLLSNGVSWNIALSCFAIVAPVAFVLALFSSFKVTKEKEADTQKPKLQAERTWIEEIKTWPVTVYLMMFALFTFCIADTMISLWLAVYGHMQMGLPKDLSSSLPSMFWGSIIIGRIIATYALKKLSQETFCIIIGVLTGEVFLILSVVPMSFVLALLITTLAGLSFAAGYTTIASIGTTQVPNASNKLTSVILVSGSVGLIAAPLFSSMMSVEYVLIATGLLILIAPVMVIIVGLINKARGYNAVEA